MIPESINKVKSERNREREIVREQQNTKIGKEHRLGPTLNHCFFEKQANKIFQYRIFENTATIDQLIQFMFTLKSKRTRTKK